jgi:hypothetical protein
MKELLRTNDLVLLTYIVSLLRDANISSMIADGQMSAVEGSIGAIPRRLLVAVDDHESAQSIMIEAGLGDHLSGQAARPGY